MSCHVFQHLQFPWTDVHTICFQSFDLWFQFCCQNATQNNFCCSATKKGSKLKEPNNWRLHEKQRQWAQFFLIKDSRCRLLQCFVLSQQWYRCCCFTSWQSRRIRIRQRGTDADNMEDKSFEMVDPECEEVHQTKGKNGAQGVRRKGGTHAGQIVPPFYSVLVVAVKWTNQPKILGGSNEVEIENCNTAVGTSWWPRPLHTLEEDAWIACHFFFLYFLEWVSSASPSWSIVVDRTPYISTPSSRVTYIYLQTDRTQNSSDQWDRFWQAGVACVCVCVGGKSHLETLDCGARALEICTDRQLWLCLDKNLVQPKPKTQIWTLKIWISGPEFCTSTPHCWVNPFMFKTYCCTRSLKHPAKNLFAQGILLTLTRQCFHHKSTEYRENIVCKPHNSSLQDNSITNNWRQQKLPQAPATK